MQYHQENKQSDKQTWEACEAGTLRDFAQRTRRRKFLQTRIVPCALVLGLLFVLYLRWPEVNSPGDPLREPYGGLTCQEVSDRTQAYFGDTLSTSERRKIEAHLEDCPLCAEKFREMRKQRSGNLAMSHELHRDNGETWSDPIRLIARRRTHTTVAPE